MKFFNGGRELNLPSTISFFFISLKAVGYAIKSDYLSFFMGQSEKVEYVPTTNRMAGDELPEQLEKISKFISIIETK